MAGRPAQNNLLGAVFLKLMTRLSSASDLSRASVWTMICAGTVSDNPISLAAVMPSSLCDPGQYEISTHLAADAEIRGHLGLSGIEGLLC